MTEQNDQELGWNDVIDPTVNEKPLLAKGPGTFEILKLDRARREYGKFGMCNIAVIKVLVTDSEGVTAVWDENLPMLKAMVWKLALFFAAIGQRNHGDPEAFKPDWKSVVGSKGKCEIGHHEWKTKKGETRTDCQIEKFIAPEPVDPDNLPW